MWETTEPADAEFARAAFQYEACLRERGELTETGFVNLIELSRTIHEARRMPGMDTTDAPIRLEALPFRARALTATAPRLAVVAQRRRAARHTDSPSLQRR